MVEPELAQREILTEFPGVELETSGPLAAILITPTKEDNFLLVVSVTTNNANQEDPQNSPEDLKVVTDNEDDVMMQKMMD